MFMTTPLKSALCCSVPSSTSSKAAADHTKPSLFDAAGQTGLQQSEASLGSFPSSCEDVDSHARCEIVNTVAALESILLPSHQSPRQVGSVTQHPVPQSSSVKGIGLESNAIGLHDSDAASEPPITTAATEALNDAQEALASASAHQAAAPEETEMSKTSVDRDATTAETALEPDRTDSAQAMDTAVVQQPMHQPSAAKNVTAEMLQWLDATLAAKKPSPISGSSALQVLIVLQSTAAQGWHAITLAVRREARHLHCSLES